MLEGACVYLCVCVKGRREELSVSETESGRYGNGEPVDEVY